MFDPNWSLPEHDLTLSPSEVHVWRAKLDEEGRSQTIYKPLLSPDELIVANRFFFEHDRIRYITSRGTLRFILANYLSMDPQMISIVQGQFGKPLLENDPHHIQFNLSHSNGLGLFAFTIGHRIGIDVERILPLRDFEQIADFFLSPNEMEALDRLPGESRLDGFYAAWTRKEAFVKALGVGIGNSLDKFEVNVSPDEEPVITALHQEIANGSVWRLLDLKPDPNYAAALAVDSDEISLRLFDFRTG